jgi:hypothetical protein
MALSAGLRFEIRISGNDTNAGAFRGGALAATPSAPSLATAASGGTVANGTYYVVITLFDTWGETPRSAQATITTTGTGISTITITAPAAAVNLIAWAVYIGTTSGGPYFLQGNCLNPGTNRVVSSTPPTTGIQAPGVDYSQQDTAQTQITDAVVDGTTNTIITSAANPFNTGHVGNTLRTPSSVLAGWTGNVTYEIIGVDATGKATLDKSPAAVSTTGGKFALGGAIASRGRWGQDQIWGQKAWKKSGTYTDTNSALTNQAGGVLDINVSGFDNDFAALIGYGTTRGDYGTPPVIIPSTSGKTLIKVSGGTVRVENVELQQGANNSTIGINTTGSNITLFKIKTTSIGDSGWDFLCAGSNTQLINCWSHNSKGVAFELQSNAHQLFGCEADGFTTTAFDFTNASGSVAVDCNAHDGLSGSSGWITSVNSRAILLVNCGGMRNGNGGGGFNIKTTSTVINSRNENNNFGTQYVGVANTAGAPGTLGNGRTVWYYNAASWKAAHASDFDGNQTFIKIAGSSYTQALIVNTADPSNNAAAGDFSLNNTAGGGALLRGTALPGAYPSGGSTSHPDVGPVQTAGVAPGAACKLAGPGGRVA